MKQHTEIRFEDAIEHHLITQAGYVKGNQKDYDPELALEPEQIINFIKSTQERVWNSLLKIHGESLPKVIINDLVKEMELKGSLKVLRQGFKSYGRTLKVAVFVPNNLKNPDLLQQYKQNRLSVTRQLHYSNKHKNSLDLAIFLNGIPIVTAELKNHLTNQTVEDAKKQYKNDRDHRELIFEFKKRTLVHFAVDPDLVFMTTRLSGSKTYFLPFNLGDNQGAGNPPSEVGYKTEYLWKYIWQRDSLLEIIGHFMHLQVDEQKIYSLEGIKRIKKEIMLFPRFHQLDVVRKLLTHTKINGTGKNYLVQHSAGSGKSNSISWLTHRLSTLHNENDDKIFDSIIVVTDRLVLDQQLQNTVYQFEHKKGVVQKIDEDTKQLVKALVNSTPIIVTTIQKFPFVTEALDKLNEDNDADYKLTTKGKKFAVIIDEAHSSQSGESSATLKGVLNKDGIKEAAQDYRIGNGMDDSEDIVIRQMMKRGKQPNISFYAFTATPKYKTKHLFDEPGNDGKSPFHLYSMRQAIEENFIIDVLENYTTYKTYFKIIKSIAEDPKVEKRKAAKALARFLTLHPHNIGQKIEVIIEHFRHNVIHKIGGRAKAMVVTESRLNAVKYKQEFDKYIIKKGYTGIKSLVAFSGTVEDPDIKDKKYTEVGMNNGIKEKELPDKFDSNEYQVLLVADKYQTGFDQPYLHSMYVDKKLSGVQAVQTLSRLNRTCTGKEETFVLDFRNTTEEIFESFKPYYEKTPTDDLIDSQHLYRLETQLLEYNTFFKEDIEEFNKIYFKQKRNLSVNDNAQLHKIIDGVKIKFNKLDEEKQESFRTLIVNFKNMYGFLSQVIPFQDSDLEKLYTFCRFLLTKIRKDDKGKHYQFDDEVALQYYRLQKISEGSITLNTGNASSLKGPSDVGTGRDDENVQLSELIQKLNDRFGTNFTQADQLFFDQIHEEARQDEDLKQAAKVNSLDDFKYVYEKAFDNLVIDRREGNEAIFGRLMKDAEFRNIAFQNLLVKLYNSFNEQHNNQ